MTRRRRQPPPPPPFLFDGPVAAYRRREAGEIRIETTKRNPAGEGESVCVLPLANEREARAVAALPLLLRSLQVFSTFGALLEGLEPDAPVFASMGGEGPLITVGDLQRAHEIYSRAMGLAPPAAARSGPRGPEPVHKP